MADGTDPPLNDEFFDKLFNTLPEQPPEDAHPDITEKLLGGKGWTEKTLNGYTFKVAPLTSDSPVYKERSLTYFYEELAKHRGEITEVEKELFHFAVCRAARSFGKCPADKVHTTIITIGSMPTGNRVMCVYGIPPKNELPADEQNPPLPSLLRVLGMDQAHTMPATVEAIGLISTGRAFFDEQPTPETVEGPPSIVIAVSLNTAFEIPAQYKQNPSDSDDDRPDAPKELLLQYLRMNVAACELTDGKLVLDEFLAPEEFIERPRAGVDMFQERAALASDLLNLLAGWQFQVQIEGGPRPWAMACMRRFQAKMHGYDEGNMFGRGDLFNNIAKDIMRYMKEKLEAADDEDDADWWKK